MEDNARKRLSPKDPTLEVRRSPRINNVVDSTFNPRRSARKCFKPLQQYEDIISQTCISSKRALVYSSEDSKKEAAEGKSVTSVQDKARRKKKKALDDVIKDGAKNSAQVGEDKKLSGKSCNDDNEKEMVGVHYVPVKPLESGQVTFVLTLTPNRFLTLKAIQDCKILKPEIPSSEVQKDENPLETLNTSKENVDIKMETIPITADDCMESRKTPLSTPNKITNAPSKVDFINKDDDNCITTSLTGSSNTDSESKIQNPPENNIPTLLVSSYDEDDLEEVFKNYNGSEEIKNTEAMAIAEKEKDVFLNCTLDGDSTIDPKKTKLYPSITRVQTPFKSAKAIIPNIIIESQEELNIGNIPELQVEYRGGKLKSSRKRSISFYVDSPMKCETFHSPAKTTVCDGDLMKTLQADVNNITVRCKRSLSETETDGEVVAYFEHIERTPSKKLKLPEQSKTPSFAAIHQQQSQRMESIAEVLSNSVTKFKSTIIHKGMPIKNALLLDCNQRSSGHNKVMSKARQRIELSGIVHKPSAEANNSVYSALTHRSNALPDPSEYHDFFLKSSFKMSSSCFVFKGDTNHRSPKPKFDATFTIKSDIKVASKSTANTATASVSQALLPDTQPRFDARTVIDRQPRKGVDKLEDRRKRYLVMYKSRSSARTVDNKSDLLNRIRTNRRFELQMMSRDRPK